MADVSKAAHTRFDTLDGMRGVAAASVLLCHFWPGAGITTNVYLANDLFFILSGFVIAHSYGSRLREGKIGSWEYMVKRFIRLYPMYLAGLLLGLYPLYYYGNSQELITKSVLLNLFYLPCLGNFDLNLFESTTPVEAYPFPADPPAWSLFFEIIASAAFILLARLRAKGLFVAVVIFFAAFIVSGIYYARMYHVPGVMAGGLTNRSFSGGYPRVLFGFALGMLLYEVLREPRLESARTFLKGIFRNSWLLYGSLLLIFAVPSVMHGYYGILIITIVAPALIYAGALVQPANGTESRIAQFLGWMSYPLYCLHFPIGGIVASFMGGTNHTQGLFTLVGTPLVFVIAIVVTAYYEEPVRIWLTRVLISKRNQASQVALQR